MAEDEQRPEIDSGEALQDWLKDKPVEWAQAIAVRAALRVFPLVFKVHENWYSYSSIASKQGLSLQVFRAAFISRAARGYPSRDMREASAYAAAIDVADLPLGNSVVYSIATTSDVVATADAVAFAANAINTTTAVAAAAATAISAADAADAADAAGAATADGRAAAMSWQAISDDCQWLLGRGTDGNLIDQPLWLSDVRGMIAYTSNLPPWVREPLHRFTARDEVKNGPWGLIVDWYRAILPEPDNAKPLSLFGEKADIAIATQPDAFWTVTEERSTEDILEEIAAIGGYGQRGLFFDGVLSSLATRILEFLEEVRRPAAFDEIHSAILALRPVYHPSLEGELGSQLAFGRIIRTSDGLYVHPKWAETDTANWDFFLSYNQHDLAVARRISDVLEDEGYAVFSQFNDMTAGKSFVGEMNKGLAGMGRMIAVYSPDYFSSGPCQSEWEAAYTVDPSGEGAGIVSFMVRTCEPSPLARRLVWTPLLGLSPADEREAVLRAVRGALPPRDRVAQRAAMKAAASPDVGLDPSGRKLDALPNAEFDRPFVDEDLFELPERLRSLIGTIIDVLEGSNAPRGLTSALRSYAAELEARGANCSLGVLRDQMAFVEAEVDDPDAENWCSGAGLKVHIASLRRLHALLLTHYPLDQERERLIRSVEVDEEKFSPEASARLRDEIRNAVREALADDSVTESYRDAVENRARVVRDALDLGTPDVPTDGDVDYTRREQDRSNRVRDAKKRALAQEAALADKTLDVIGKMAKIADSPAVQRLARAMHDLAEWFW